MNVLFFHGSKAVFLGNVFIFSHFRTEYVIPRRSLSVRLFVCVPACVCVSRPLIFTIFCRFWWNLDHVILTKIRDDTFLKFGKFCFDDNITIFCCFQMRHSHVFNFCLNFLQTWSIISSTHSFVWDCNRAFSDKIFYPIWPPKITGKRLNTKFEKKLKIKQWLLLIWIRWWRIWPYLGLPVFNSPL